MTRYVEYDILKAKKQGSFSFVFSKIYKTGEKFFHAQNQEDTIMKKIWKITATAIALTFSLSTIAACGEDDLGTISGNYEEATAQEAYTTLSSINLAALQGVNPETGEQVENPRIAAQIENDLDFDFSIGEEYLSTSLGLGLQLRSWETDAKELNTELAGTADFNFKASSTNAYFIYNNLLSPNNPMLDADGNKITPPPIDFSVDAAIYANNDNAFLKAGTNGFNLYEGTYAGSNQLISASLADKNFNWMYKFDMNELIALFMGGGEEVMNTSAVPDSTYNPDESYGEQPTSLIELLGLTEEVLLTGSTAFGLEYALDVGRKDTKIKISTTDATKAAINLMLMASEADDTSSDESVELPTQFEKLDVALYLQISDNGTPLKISASVDIKVTTYDESFQDDFGSNKGTISLSNYLDVDFGWIKDSILPQGITESTDYQAVTVDEFMMAIDEYVGLFL